MIDNLDTIRIFNSLKEEFPTVKDIYSLESDLGGSLESIIFEEGGETQFYLTKEDQVNYVPTILAYYTLQQIIHIIEPFDKATHLLHIAVNLSKRIGVDKLCWIFILIFVWLFY